MTCFIKKTGAGPPIVLMHGWGFDHRIWQAFIDASPGFTYYVVDLPGFGRTPLMPWDDFKHILLQQLPPDFTLVGWSLGGLLATRLAIEAPTRVCYLMNITTSPYFVAEQNWPGIDAMVLNAFYRRLRLNPKETIKQFIAVQLQKHVTAFTPDDRYQPDGLRYGLDCLRTWDFRNSISLLTMPVSYVFGRLDAILPYKIYQKMRMQYPQFTYTMLTDSSHAPLISHIPVLRHLLSSQF